MTTPAEYSPPLVVASIPELRKHMATWRQHRRSIGFAPTIGFVPTMGALHDGHLSLINAAASQCEFVIVSIFVNPTQFGPNEDFSRYPRTWEQDRELCAAAGVDLIFMPAAEAIYPPGFATFVEVAGLSEILEGAARPGHFRGVTTVVLKLLEIVAPDVAYFGSKDYQQQLIIRRMATDLALRVRIETCPTVREPDGLAMSSRNRYLDENQRQKARSISAALFATRHALHNGESNLKHLRQQMRTIMEQAGLEVDYATIANTETLVDLSSVQPEMALLAAARIGGVRLIDHLEVGQTSDE